MAEELGIVIDVDVKTGLDKSEQEIGKFVNKKRNAPVKIPIAIDKDSLKAFTDIITKTTTVKPIPIKINTDGIAEQLRNLFERYQNGVDIPVNVHPNQSGGNNGNGGGRGGRNGSRDSEGEFTSAQDLLNRYGEFTSAVTVMEEKTAQLKATIGEASKVVSQLFKFDNASGTLSSIVKIEGAAGKITTFALTLNDALKTTDTGLDKIQAKMVSITGESDKQKELDDARKAKLATQLEAKKVELENQVNDIVKRATTGSQALDAVHMKEINKIVAETKEAIAALDSLDAKSVAVINGRIASIKTEVRAQKYEQYPPTKLTSDDIKAAQKLAEASYEGFDIEVKKANVDSEALKTTLAELKSIIDGTFNADAVQLFRQNMQLARQQLRTATGQKTLDDRAENLQTMKTADTKALDAYNEKLARLGLASTAAVDKINTLKQAIADAKDAKGVETVRKQFDELKESLADNVKQAEAFQKKVGSIKEHVSGKTSELDKWLDYHDISAASFEVDVMNGGVANTGIQKLYQEIEAIKAKYEEFIAELNGGNIDSTQYEKLTARLALLDQRMSQAATQAKLFNGSLASSQQLERAAISIERLKTAFNTWMANTNAGNIPELTGDIDDFRKILDNVDAVSLPNAQKQWSLLQAKFREVSGDTKLVSSTMADLGKLLTRFVGGAAVFNYLTRGAREAVQAVKELDKAMIELRKVTDLSERGYEKYLDNAAESAREIGTSLKDYVTSTAD